MITVSEYAATSESVFIYDKNVRLSSVTVFLWEPLWPISILEEKENKQKTMCLGEVLKFLAPLHVRDDKNETQGHQIWESPRSWEQRLGAQTLVSQTRLPAPSAYCGGPVYSLWTWISTRASNYGV